MSEFFSESQHNLKETDTENEPVIEHASFSDFAKDLGNKGIYDGFNLGGLIKRSKQADLSEAVLVASFGHFKAYAKKVERVFARKNKPFSGSRANIERINNFFDYLGNGNKIIKKNNLEELKNFLSDLAGKGVAVPEIGDLIGEEKKIYHEPFVVFEDPANNLSSESETEINNLRIGLDFSGIPKENLEEIPEALRHLPEFLELGRGLQLIVGQNGSGKTTFLYALRLASRAKRFEMTASEFLRLPSSENEARVIKIFADAIKLPKYFPIELLDLAKGIEKTRERLREKSSDKEDITGEQMAGRLFSGGSNRQTADTFSQRFIHERKINSRSIVLIDEPEHGMDPWRHRQILEEIKKDFGDCAIVVIATNSPLLVFDSPLPRIDLRSPEKGLVPNDSEIKV